MILPVVTEMFGALRGAIDQIGLRVSDVRYATLTGTERYEKIEFLFDGQPHSAELRGRNANYVLSDNPELNRRFAVRLILDGFSTVRTNTEKW